MEVFRISKQKYAMFLSGKGAAIHGARWNSKGVEMIYTASNRSLAMAEVAVSLNLASLSVSFCMMSIYIPDDASIQSVKLNDLPPDWNSIPASDSTRIIGDDFVLSSQYLGLRVPSIVTPGDWNILINPLSSEFQKIKLLDSVPFSFDRRIF